MMNGAAVMWKTKTLHTPRSTTEAEYMALSAGESSVQHLRQLLDFMGYTQDRPTPIFEDNMGAVLLAHDPKYHERTKHIKPHYHAVRQSIADGEVEVVYCPTEYQLCDLLTKALNKDKTDYFTQRILMGKIDMEYYMSLPRHIPKELQKKQSV